MRNYGLCQVMNEISCIFNGLRNYAMTRTLFLPLSLRLAIN